VRRALFGDERRKQTGLALRAVREGAIESEYPMRMQTEDFVSSVLGLVLCAANVSFLVLLLS